MLEEEETIRKGGELEKTISKVRGVISNRVVFDKTGEIQEIHVLGEAFRGPKQIVRDIESACMALFGIKLDHKKISIAQLTDSENSRDNINIGRLCLKSLHVNVMGTRMETRVTLENNDGLLFEGTASGLITEKNRLRLAALSTLSAIETFLNEPDTFILEDVGITRLGKEEISFCLVALISSGSEETFIGAALVRGSREETIVRATLDAVNRHLTR